MASSMLTAEAVSASTESDVDKALKTALHTSTNDPDFAIICDFLQKFSKDLGLDLPNFKLLLQWLTKTDEVSPQLRDMQIKLLRKTRKTVHEKSWESALSKFCFSYSAHDGWEIERFGYKNSSVKVKLRILRELLECQFERNTKFRAKILSLSADSLRSKPIGRDRHGHAYWVTQDNECNIRIYQEHLDEEIWQVVATNRDEFVKLIQRLRGSEVVQPCKDISTIDEDTNSSSQIESDSVKKSIVVEKKSSALSDEQKIPKISIKLVHGKSAKEPTNTKNLGRGEEELAAEEDEKLLKKSKTYSESIEGGEDEFEEIEEEYDAENGSGSEIESDDEISTGKKGSNEKQIEEKFQNNLKSKDENKKVKPLVISQNKVLSHQNCTVSSIEGRKRALDEEDMNSPREHENEQICALKKLKPSVLESKRSNPVEKYVDNKKTVAADFEDSVGDADVEEEVEEEDIDSVAAEEDENEEKMFEDYDDEDDEEIGQEVSDPILHVSGEGSGRDCNAENYLHFIDYDFDDNNQAILSEIIIEDVYYVSGEGNGKECLVGNKNDDSPINSEEKVGSEVSNTNKEEQTDTQFKSSSPTANQPENIECFNLSTSKKIVAFESSSTDAKTLVEDSNGKNDDENFAKSIKNENEYEEKQEIPQINGEKLSKENNAKNESFGEEQSDPKNVIENVLLPCDTKISRDKTEESACKEDNLGISNTDSDPVELTEQTSEVNKVSAMESVKEELEESKQTVLEKQLPQTSECSNMKISSTPVYNRKRRLTDQLQTTIAKPPNSESEIDYNIDNEELKNNKDFEIIDSSEDVGGKRLKIRSKQTNTELRRKIEAQKVAAQDETTSSSADEEEIKKRKNIISKHPNVILKSSEKLQNLECTEANLAKSDENVKLEALTQQITPIKMAVQTIPTKVKPTLAEIIEKKLKKSEEKTQTSITAPGIDGNMMEANALKTLIPCTKKNPVIKPLEEKVLTEIKQNEDDEEDTIPRKRTNSEDLNLETLNENKSFEPVIKTIPKIHNENQKSTCDRQRKRRSSEETVQKDSPEEPEAKKEVMLIKENIITDSDKPNKSTKDDIMKVESKDFEIENKLSMSVTGRRSGRRSKIVPTYADNLQTKRYRGATKSSSKKDEHTDCEEFETINEHAGVEEKIISNDIEKDVEKSNGNKLPNDKSTSLPKKIYRKEDKVKEDLISRNMSKIEVTKSTIKTPVKSVRKQNEVDATNIIDVDSETPVRQSRRIAQQKIREEAERRKLEEIALRTMKQELKKKKKAEKQSDPAVISPTEPSSESEECDIEIKKKVQKKKCPGKNGNWSSGSEEQEEPEEEEEPPHYETDPGSPLFKSDHEFSPESDIEDESQAVPMKRARTVRKEDAEGDAAVRDEEEACQNCNKSDHPEWILLCDNCDKGYHCSCLSPVLFYIPEGDWYCPPCQQDQLIKALEHQLKEFDDLVENKKKAEEQEKRIAEEERLRQEKEEEIKRHRQENDKKVNARRNSDNSSAEDRSQEGDDNDEETTTNSDDSKDSHSNTQSGRNKNWNRSRNSKNSDKRNYRDRRHNSTRIRRNKLKKLGNNFSDESQCSKKFDSESESNSSSSSTYSDSDNEPIYKLRKRRQINVSYRLNEYDDLINSALKKEMDDAAGAGNLGRGKDISTIIEADKEEKARLKQIEEVVTKPKEVEIDSMRETENSLNIEPKSAIDEDENDSDGEPIIRKINVKASQKKKSRKLTTLDISSEDDDGSDEDFKGSSFDDEEEEEDSSISVSNSDSSLEVYKRHGKSKKKRRKAARRAFRERRKDRNFLVEESEDEEELRPKSKKKRSDDSDYTESEADDDISELSENIDSADLCDDTTTDESDGAWRPNSRKKAKKSSTSLAQKSPKFKETLSKKVKKVEYSDDDVSESDEEDDENDGPGSGKGMGKQPRSQPLKTNSSSAKTKGKGKEKPSGKIKKKISSEDESSHSGSEDSTRRTRGRRYAYIEDFDDDSSDGGIKPGVQRPDTPPEEREKFIKRQEEIKRMLAEKNAEGAKLVATPRLTPIKTDTEKDKRSPAKTGDSLSTVPLSVIRQAKVLDIDYLQRKGENLDDFNSEVGEVDDEFDDADLPDDLPEDMDEDAIARMVEEEEEFAVSATRDLSTTDDVLRTPATLKSIKTKEAEKPASQGNTSSLPINGPQMIPSIPSSGLQEPVRKRLPMPTMHPPLLRHQYLMHDSMPNTQHLMQRHSSAQSSQLLQNALSAPLNQPLDRNYPPTSTHHPLINKMAHSIPLQSTVPHALGATKSSQQPAASIVAKSSALIEQQPQEKLPNPQTINECKPRGRRKKITPLRDTLQKQQAAAAVTAATATSSALASSLVKNNDPASTSLLPSVIKSGSSQKLPIPASVITSIPPTHSAGVKPGVHMSPLSGPYVRNDGPRFYDALGNRISQSSGHRQRVHPQIPPSILPPHPANRSSYGLPPPLKGSNPAPPVSSPPNTPGTIRSPIRHIPPPYLGIPPNVRHASHLNIYSRPPIFGNPNFGPRINLRAANIHSPDYTHASRGYPPYGFYPPPPPLTTPGQRSGSVSRPSTQMPPIQSALTHPPPSVIVSATASKVSNEATIIPHRTHLEITDPSPSTKPVVVTQESLIDIAHPKSPSTTPVIAPTEKIITATLGVAEPRRKLTTLQAYVGNSGKKSPVSPRNDSSGSQSPSNHPIDDINDDSSALGTTENISTAEHTTRQEGQVSEFSGLVSYFSSQHDDYNT